MAIATPHNQLSINKLTDFTATQKPFAKKPVHAISLKMQLKTVDIPRLRKLSFMA
jgi:hypothetical protein